MTTQLKRKQIPFQIKEVGDKGEVAGYASVFGVKDSYGEIVVEGAFDQTLDEHKEKGTSPKVLFQHRHADIIGEHIKLQPDSHGLYAEFQLYHDDTRIPEAGKAFALAQRGQLSGISIGFSLYPGGLKYDKDQDALLLTNINLWENSLVTFAANPEAEITDVKSTVSVEMVRQLMSEGETPRPALIERALRSLGMEKKQAMAFMSKGYSALSDSPDTTNGNESAQMEANVVAEINRVLQNRA